MSAAALPRHLVRRSSPADPERVLDVARATLAASGFRVGEARAGELSAEGPGWSSSKQPALQASSQMWVRARSGEVEVEAELGGWRRLSRFVWIFPFALVGGLALLFFGLQQLGAMPAGPGTWAPLLAIAPWFVLAPWISRVLRRRAESALVALADSLASA